MTPKLVAALALLCSCGSGPAWLIEGSPYSAGDHELAVDITLSMLEYWIGSEPVDNVRGDPMHIVWADDFVSCLPTALRAAGCYTPIYRITLYANDPCIGHTALAHELAHAVLDRVAQADAADIPGGLWEERIGQIQETISTSLSGSGQACKEAQNG